jgi:hypothetical protein
MRKLLSELDFWLRDDSPIDDDSHIFGTLYYRDMFTRLQFLLEHLPFQGHVDFKQVCLGDS